MTYYEIYHINNTWEIWKWTNNGQDGERFKVFKSRKAAENWASKQWLQVTWR